MTGHFNIHQHIFAASRHHVTDDRHVSSYFLHYLLHISLNVVTDHLVMLVMRGASLYSTGQINSPLSFDPYPILGKVSTVVCQEGISSFIVDDNLCLLVAELSTKQPASLFDRTCTLYLRWPERPERCSGLSAQSAQADIKYIRVHLITSGGGGQETNAWRTTGSLQW